VDDYIDDFGKCALALTSAQLAKDTAVKEHGIGEDIATHFIGWVGPSLMIIAQMKSEISKEPHAKRFTKCKKLCLMLRKYWGVTGITMVAEGYCSSSSEKTKGIELADAFLDPDMPVKECLTITHVSTTDDGEIMPVAMLAAPYTVNLGKTVNWDEILIYPENGENHTRHALYPVMLRKTMDEKFDSSIPMSQYNEIRDEISRFGFLLQEF
jgi:hypothetical protein